MIPRTTFVRLAAGAAATTLAGCMNFGSCKSPWFASPQFDAVSCRFVNAPNPEARLTKPQYLLMLRFLIGKPDGTVPVDPLPVKRLDPAALAALDPAGVHVVRLGHSSHLLKLRGRYWLIDPVFAERASPFSFAGPKRFHQPPIGVDELPEIAGLVLSHDHYDHLDTATIAALRASVQRYFVPLGVAERLVAAGVEPSRIAELDWWQESTHAEVKLTATPAHHFSGRTLSDRDRTLWASWVLDLGNARIFYSGDTGWFPAFHTIGERFGPFDLALMENGAYNPEDWPSSHMTPEQTVRAARAVGAKLLYGVHNSTFDLAFHPWQEPMERLADLAERDRLPYASPVIGEVLTLGVARPNVRWWRGLR